MKHIKNLAIVLAFIFLGGCASDDVDNAPERDIVITTLDLTTSILDNLTQGDVVATVTGRTNIGLASFAITSQTPENALAIDEIAGELTVANATLIDATTTPEINMVVTVSNGSVSKTANVIVIVEAAPVDNDGDGVFNDTDPDDSSPCFPVQNPGYIDFDATNAIWMAADCDGDGIINTDEVSNGTDPYVDNSVVCDSTANTDIWDGDFTVTEGGFVGQSTTPAIAGCGTLIIPDPVGFGPCDGNEFEILFTFTPFVDGATAGTIEALEQPYICSFLGPGSTYSATGVYDEITQTITLNYSVGGAFPFSGTNEISPN